MTDSSVNRNVLPRRSTSGTQSADRDRIVIPDEVIADCLFVRRRWVQERLHLDPEELACQIMDETADRWEVHRGFRGRPVWERITARFGWPGVTSTLGGRKQRVHPMPEVLMVLSSVLSQYLVGPLGTAPMNFVYCNIYTDGDANIRKHCDRGFLELSPVATIASLSFGAARTFRMTNQRDRTKEVDCVLQAGDLAVMYGRCQLEWLHSIPKERHITEPRLSLTYRYHRKVG